MSFIDACGRESGVSANLMNTDSRFEFAFVTPVLTTTRSSSVLGCLTQVTCHSVIYAGHPPKVIARWPRTATARITWCMALKRMCAACSSACAALPPRTLVMLTASWQAAGPPKIVFGHGGFSRGTAATACWDAGRRRFCHPRGMATETPGKDSRAGAPGMGVAACPPLPGAAPAAWLHPAAGQIAATTIAVPRSRANLLAAPGATS